MATAMVESENTQDINDPDGATIIIDLIGGRVGRISCGQHG